MTQIIAESVAQMEDRRHFIKRTLEFIDA